MMRFLPEPKCGPCGKKVSDCRCTRKKNSAVKRDVKAAQKEGRPDPSPHPCPVAGCGRTVRGGVCPSPTH